MATFTNREMRFWMEDSLRLSFQKTDPKMPPRPKPSATLVRGETGKRGGGGGKVANMLIGEG